MKYHFIGIGGIGMSGLARVLCERGKQVTGSDIQKNSQIESLEKMGAKIEISHKKENIKDQDYIIYSSSIQKDNEELLFAKKNKKKILHRSDLLKEITKGKKRIVVTGTHGKTTTTSLLIEVLVQAKKNPGFALGGILQSLKKNAQDGEKYFVIEADESDGSFLKIPSIANIVTNIEKEHLDYWKTFSDLKKGFQKFFASIKNKDLFFYCKEDPVLKSLHPKGISYGFSKDCNLFAFNIRQGEKSCFDINFKGKIFKDVSLNLFGKHNILNALGVFGLLCSLKIDEKIIFKAFSSFLGVQRRMDIIGEHRKILFIDDYAHHPTEIKNTLEALRNRGKEKRIIAVFQPHRYSRFKELFKEFLTSFSSCDHLIATDIYSAGEKKIKAGIKDFVKKIDRPCEYVSKDQLKEAIVKKARPHDIFIFLGAGDISITGRNIFEEFKKEFKKKIKIAFFYGGKSEEHDVSIKSAENIYNSLDKEIYDILSFYVSKKGKIFSSKNFQIYKKDFLEILSSIISCDIAFPILHGPFGEDGMIQGFLDMINKKYVGCGYTSSVLCMNKSFIKHLIKERGFETSNFISFKKDFFQKNKKEIFLEISKKLQFPLFIKPNALGSSIGIYRAEEEIFLEEQIKKVFLLDDTVLLEEEMKGKEIEFSLLGNENIEVSLPGEIMSEGFYDFKKKYGKNLDGKGAVRTKVPADISKEDMERGQNIACEIYKIAGCRGFARIDFFFFKGKFYFNEINTIPGFTKTSLYHKMWEKSGLDVKTLLDRLIILGMRDAKVF